MAHLQHAQTNEELPPPVPKSKPSLVRSLSGRLLDKRKEFKRRQSRVLAKTAMSLADDESIAKFLSALKLEKLQSKFDKLGVVVVGELRDVDDGDFRKLTKGLTKFERKRLDDSLSLLRGDTTARLDEMGITIGQSDLMWTCVVGRLRGCVRRNVRLSYNTVSERLRVSVAAVTR